MQRAEAEGVGPDVTELPRTTACPSCGASVRPDAPWCMLCHTDLRPKAPEPAAQVAIAPAPTAAYGPPAPDPLTQPLHEVLGEAPGPAPAPAPAASWPCSMCEAVNPITANTCSDCGQSFLAAMRSTEQPMLVLPVVGDIGKLSRGGRIGLAFALVALVLIPLAALTLLLTHRPPADPPSHLPSPPVVVTTQ